MHDTSRYVSIYAHSLFFHIEGARTDKSDRDAP